MTSTSGDELRKSGHNERWQNAPMHRRLFVLLCLFASLTAHADRRRASSPNDTIVVGGLFSLTGEGASLGKASQTMLELAARDLNAELDALQLPYHVVTAVYDTKLTPAGAFAGIQSLHARGANIIIGPQSSAEAAALLSYANDHGIVVISQASTASSLAIPNDYLFRLAPNDKLEGAAMAALMHADGVDTIVPVWRADAGNTGLRNGVAQFFSGTMADGVSYDPTTTDFAPIVKALGDAVRAAKNANPNAKIGVYLASFEEGAAILDLARLDPDLLLHWYGGDGLTQTQAPLSTPAIAAFATATTFTAPGVALVEQTRNRWEKLSTEPDAYSLSVYDAAWAAVLALVETRNRAELLRDAFLRTTERYWGVTGPLALDAAGDRRVADFDFWTVQGTDWVRTASYAGGRVAR
jgi:branched-chain amino acid transport system substrate-binding protein